VVSDFWGAARNILLKFPTPPSPKGPFFCDPRWGAEFDPKGSMAFLQNKFWRPPMVGVKRTQSPILTGINSGKNVITGLTEKKGFLPDPFQQLRDWRD
jgi:hypothetical protein